MMNNTAMNLGVQIPLRDPVLNYLESIPRSEIGNLMFRFLKCLFLYFEAVGGEKESQAGSALPAQSPMQGSNSGTRSS